MSEIFLVDGWRFRAGIALSLAAPAAAGLQLYAYPTLFGDVGGAGFLRVIFVLLLLALGLHFAIGIARRSEPIIEVSDALVRWSSIYPGSPRGELPIDEIRGASLQAGWLLLDTRSGGLERVGIGLLRPATRERVRDAIERRVARR